MGDGSSQYTPYLAALLSMNPRLGAGVSAYYGIQDQRQRQAEEARKQRDYNQLVQDLGGQSPELIAGRWRLQQMQQAQDDRRNTQEDRKLAAEQRTRERAATEALRAPEETTTTTPPAASDVRERHEWTPQAPAGPPRLRDATGVPYSPDRAERGGTRAYREAEGVWPLPESPLRPLPPPVYPTAGSEAAGYREGVASAGAPPPEVLPEAYPRRSPIESAPYRTQTVTGPPSQPTIYKRMWEHIGDLPKDLQATLIREQQLEQQGRLGQERIEASEAAADRRAATTAAGWQAAQDRAEAAADRRAAAARTHEEWQSGEHRRQEEARLAQVQATQDRITARFHERQRSRSAEFDAKTQHMAAKERRAHLEREFQRAQSRFLALDREVGAGLITKNEKDPRYMEYLDAMADFHALKQKRDEPEAAHDNAGNGGKPRKDKVEPKGPPKGNDPLGIR